MTACGMFSLYTLQMMDLVHHIISAGGRRDGENIDSSPKECVHECAKETPTTKPV